MISVVIPIYNKEKYICRIMNSLKEQTYQNIEVIIIDDGSTDDSYKIAKSYEDNKKVFVYKQINQGVSAARNKGISYSKGEWLSFLDPDDLITKTYFEELIKFENNYDIIACCCYAVDGDKKELNRFFPSNMTFTGKRKRILFRQLLDETYLQPGKTFTAVGVPWGKLYRRSFIIKNNLHFNTKLKKQEDNVFNMYAFKYARRIFYLNKPLYLYFIEHIKNDYISTYDNYAIQNAKVLQQERMNFFNKNHMFFDKQTRRIFNDTTVSLLIGSFNKYLLNKENSQTYFEKRKLYFNIINFLSFKKVLDSLNIFEVNGFIHRVIAFFMKCKLFYPVNFIWYFRSIYVNMKYKR